MCILIFSTNLSETFFILRRTKLNVIKIVYRVSYNVPVILVRLSRHIFEKYSILNFMKIRPVVTVLFHADRTTDGQRGMMKLTVTFLNFGNAPKVI